jgi:hypothetical protein
MIRGIGPVYAKKMIKAFGEKVFDVIEAEPDRLREVIGPCLGSKSAAVCSLPRARGPRSAWR